MKIFAIIGILFNTLDMYQNLFISHIVKYNLFKIYSSLMNRV
jgi:hypothetical protein